MKRFNLWYLLLGIGAMVALGAVNKTAVGIDTLGKITQALHVYSDDPRPITLANPAGSVLMYIDDAGRVNASALSVNGIAVGGSAIPATNCTYTGQNVFAVNQAAYGLDAYDKHLWHFTDNVTDSIAAASTTAFNTPTYTAVTSWGKAITTDGTNQYARVTTPESLGAGDWSICLRFKQTSVSDDHIYAYRDDGSGVSQAQAFISGTDLYCQANDGTARSMHTGAGAIANNTWYTLLMYRSGTTLTAKYAVDGGSWVTVGSPVTGVSGTMMAGSYDLWIGRQVYAPAPEYFHGQIDEFKVRVGAIDVLTAPPTGPWGEATVIEAPILSRGLAVAAAATDAAACSAIGAVQGAGLTGALNTAAPNDTNNVSSLTASGGSTNQFLALVPKGLGGVLADIPDGAAGGGNVRGSYAVDLQGYRTANTMAASGEYACILGGESNTASGNDSACGGGSNNRSSGATSVCAGGISNVASSTSSTVSGGESNTASTATHATIAGGKSNTASGQYSFCGGGFEAIASLFGQDSRSSGKFAAAGDAQTSVLMSRNTTTNATPTDLFLDGTDDIITLASDRMCTFSIMVSAVDIGTGSSGVEGDCAGYRIEGVIRNLGGTTALVGAVTVTVIAESVAGWDATATADNTGDAIKLTVTGEADKNIRWVARTTLTEIDW